MEMVRGVQWVETRTVVVACAMIGLLRVEDLTLPAHIIPKKRPFYTQNGSERVKMRALW
jgi:hypothetical protein